jgi:hypothetical protein
MCQRVRYQRDKHYCDGDNGRNPFQTGQGNPLHATLLFKVKRFVVHRERVARYRDYLSMGGF